MAKPRKNIVFFALSLLYTGITEVRNFLFDKAILRSVRFPLPIICVGNLAVGGTGKTPHTEFLLRILSKKYKTAVLSRGYKRATSGFMVADAAADARRVGDEPFQIFEKFPQTVVAVDEQRVRGVQRLMSRFPDTEIIVLDDAFQHRKIRAGLNILLTDFSLLFTEDHLLPYGTLRELPKNSKRAEIVIITKCPSDFDLSQKSYFWDKLNLRDSQALFFSTLAYGAIYPVFAPTQSLRAITGETTVLVVAGIENPQPMLDYLQQFTTKIEVALFSDHHDFTRGDVEKMAEKWDKLSGEKLIITTEKDAARMKSNAHISAEIKENLFALPVEIRILNDHELFIQKINDYVRENSTNG